MLMLAYISQRVDTYFMSEMSIDEQRVKIRLTRGESFYSPNNRCIQELAEVAVSSEFSGFQDPKLDAVIALEDIESFQKSRIFSNRSNRISVDCPKQDCNVTIALNKSTDEIDLVGECAIADVCVKPLWDSKDTDDHSELMKVGINFANEHNAGTHCPHLDCSYNCGFSIDGHAGDGGQCREEIKNRSE